MQGLEDGTVKEKDDHVFRVETSAPVRTVKWLVNLSYPTQLLDVRSANCVRITVACDSCEIIMQTRRLSFQKHFSELG